MVRAASADEIADRLERSLDDEVKLLALTVDERAIILITLETHPKRSPKTLGSTCTSEAARVCATQPDSAAVGTLQGSARTGSTAAPRTRNSKCKCGPVAPPVAPTRPITVPTSTRCPTRTVICARWA
jgi:hypothetical protein